MDKKNVSWWQAHRPTTRRLVQLYSALLHNAYLKGFITGQIYQGKAKYVCAPGFNCYSCPGAVGACPLGAIQNALASTGHRAGWYVLGIILLYGVILGRTICGWLCPLGLIQELLHKIPTPKIRKSKITRALSWLKYVILAVFVIALPLWYGVTHDLPLPGFCKYICPAGTSEGAMGLLANPANASFYSMLGILFTRKFVIMLVIFLACVFCYRSFCRFICPLGAIYGLFNRFNVIGVKVDQSRCNGCGACVRHCGMDVKRVGDHECINCGKCMAVCHQGAISMKAGKITLKVPEMGCAGDGPNEPEKRKKRGRVLWGAALAVLCFALIWFNFLDPSGKTAAGQTPSAQPAATDAPVATDAPAVTEAPAATEVPAVTEAPASESYESDAALGREVGNRLPDFTLTCYDGSTFHLADCRGKIVFINLWATYCTPCKQELPYFSALYEAHKEDLAIVAVHPSLITDDPKEYLQGKGLTMPFATDEKDEVCGIVGYSGTLPQTIVLNRKGEIVYNQVGSVTPEMLDELYQKAGGSAAKAPAEAPVVTDASAATDAPAASESYESDAPLGREVGNRLPDFTLNCYDGSTFHLADCRGKIVFINLWATYCTPCKQELPYFSALYEAHREDLAMVAVHPSLITDDPKEYLQGKGLTMPFATDEKDEVCGIVGYSGTLPQTIVLNRKGEIIYNQVGSVTPEMLGELYQKAGGSAEKAPAEAPVVTDASAATEAPAAAESYESDAPLGREVGNRLPDFTLNCYDGSTFHLADCRGKIVFINLWATYCTPCKQELPYFSALYEAHKEDLAMVAVHPSLITDDPKEYLQGKGLTMPFATDEKDEVCGIVGYSGTLPQTIVLNRKGEIVYNQVGSVTPEMLNELYKQAAE